VSRIVDLSQEIFEGAPVFPGHPTTRIEYVATHQDAGNAPVKLEGLTYAAMMLHMCDHGPTHVDSISHIDERPGALAIDQSPLAWFMTPAIALDFTGAVGPREEISLELLEERLDATGLEPPRDGTFLFTAGHYRRTYPDESYVHDYPGLSHDAANFLYRDCGIRNIGADAPSIEAGANVASHRFPCHVLCRELQRLNTENLANIEDVAGDEFLYIGLPLKIRAGTGSPVRAVAVLDGEEVQHG
jgi:kynurenine formamidase